MSDGPPTASVTGGPVGPRVITAASTAAGSPAYQRADGSWYRVQIGGSGSIRIDELPDGPPPGVQRVTFYGAEARRPARARGRGWPGVACPRQQGAPRSLAARSPAPAARGG